MSQEEKKTQPAHRPGHAPAHEPERRTPRPASGQGAPRPAGRTGEEPRRAPARRRRRRRMGIVGALMYVVMVIGVSGLLAGLAWLAAGDVLALNKPLVEASVTLEEELFTSWEETGEDGTVHTVTGADVGKVAQRLEEAGIVDYPFLFRVFAAVTHGDRKLAPGTYSLNTKMDYRALISNMSARSPARATVTVTIPEGYTAAQIFERLEERGVCTAEELRLTAANYDFKFSFLKDVVPLGDYRRLEGYLFPDTYTFYKNDEPVNVLNKLILRFDEKFTDEMRQRAADGGRTVREIVTIASLIEKETTGNDQTTISSVIYNRLDKPTAETNGLLQIDATLVYINGGREPTEADKALDDPYNTYLYAGLPAGPIANPGEASIRAAMNPADEKYYYYALGDDGEHHFFKTLKGQQDFIRTQSYYKNNG